MRRSLLLILGLMAAPMVTASAHPLHTTIAEMTEDRSRGVVRAMIRVFAEDFASAVGRASHVQAPSGSMPSEAAALTYLSTHFVLAGGTGRPLPLRSCGMRRVADLYFACVEADERQGLSGLVVHSVMLTELFDDQVNIVQATVQGARKSLLFTRGNKPKGFG